MDAMGCSLAGSNTIIELIEYQNPPSDKNTKIGKADQIGFRHFAFAVKDIESEMYHLKQKGVEFLSDMQVCDCIGKKMV